MGVQETTTSLPVMGSAMSEYALENPEFIGMRVFVPKPVDKEAAKFKKIKRESLLQRADVKRGVDGSYNRIDMQTEEGQYSCVKRGLEFRLEDDARKRFASQFDAEEYAAKIVTRAVLMEQEIRVKTALFNTNTFTGASLYTDVATTWATASADIQADVLAAREKSYDLTGMVPNALIFGRQVLYNCILKNTKVQDSIKYTKEMTPAALRTALSGYFDTPFILIGGGTYNGANEGQDFSAGNVWGSSYAMVASVASGPSAPELEACIGRTFVWTESTNPEDLAERLIEVIRYREDQTESDIVKASQNVDEVLFDASYGHLLKID